MQINPKKVIEDKIISNVVNPEKQIQQVGIDLTLKHDFIIRAGKHLNVEVNEKFDMKNCFGLIKIRSSLSRIGITCSSGVYDTGFKGDGGITLYNHSDVDFQFNKNQRVVQIIIFKADAASDYNGYYNQGGTKSKLKVENEI